VEWVEVTGRSLKEATEHALEQLGVAEADAEIQVVEEPKTGLFGRVRGEARVRARVQPTSPRPKRSRGGSNRSRSKGQGSSQGGQREGKPSGDRQQGQKKDGGRQGGRGSGEKAAGAAAAAKAAPTGGARRNKEEDEMADGVTLEEQAAVAKEFLEGLLETMDLQATVEVRPLDDETVELAVDGEGLGMLVGPRGTTLAALQDVTRTVVQGRYAAKTDRILVDVARYRERRAVALTKFAHEQAAEVVASGDERSLEPMSPADRKVVHDAINDVDGVTTRSEGEDARRHIVIAPAG
jgi:spoIIIJ-associated protein